MYAEGAGNVQQAVHNCYRAAFTNSMRTMDERWNIAAEAEQDIQLQRSLGGVDGSGIERVV